MTERKIEIDGLEYIFNKNMKVFSQLYVGVHKKSNDGRAPLAFATPYEDNAAGRKRQETVKNWLGSVEYVIDEETGQYKRGADGCLVTRPIEKDIRIVDNEPREGFKITDDVKRVYWGGGNVVWRVYDPTGYELEIQSSNLLALIRTAGLQPGGEINGKCVWGRSGSDNILLHESSEEYKNSIKAAETLKKPKEVSAAERKVGHEYLLLDGSTAIYLGKFWVVKELETESREYSNLIFDDDNQPNLSSYKCEHSLQDPVQYEAVLVGKLPSGYFSFRNTSVRLYKKAPLVREVGVTDVTEQQMLQVVSDPKNCYWAGNATGHPVLVTRHKPANYEFFTTPADAEKVLELFKSDNYMWKYLEQEYARTREYREKYPDNNYNWYPNINSLFREYVLVEDGQVFIRPNLFRDAYYTGKPRNNCFGVALLEGRIYKEFIPQEMNSITRWVSDGPSPLRLPDIKSRMSPIFNSADEIKDWFKMLLDTGKLQKISVREI